MSPEQFAKLISDATKQYTDGAITSVEYIMYLATKVREFDEAWKEGESFSAHRAEPQLESGNSGFGKRIARHWTAGSGVREAEGH